MASVVLRKGFVFSGSLQDTDVLSPAQLLMLCVLHEHSCLRASINLLRDPGPVSSQCVMNWPRLRWIDPDCLEGCWTFAVLTTFLFALSKGFRGEKKKKKPDNSRTPSWGPSSGLGSSSLLEELNAILQLLKQLVLARAALGTLSPR